jgi:hypothetical protein
VTALVLLTLLASGPGLGVEEGVELDSPAATLLDVREVKAGEPSPGAGCWLEERSCVTIARERVADKEELKALRAQPTVAQPPLLPVIGAFVLGLLAGYSYAAWR